MAGLRTHILYRIIALAFVLAVGFLLVILSGALYHNWITLLVVAIFVLTPVPNALFSRCGGGNDYLWENSGGPVDIGKFLTSIFIVSGFCFPVILSHAGIIEMYAMIMSIAGGLLVYSTIMVYTHFFAAEGEDF